MSRFLSRFSSEKNMQILQIPEIAGLDSHRNILRIPPEVDVPFTDRVRSIVDTAEFRRLARVSQLGFVSLVYPGADHSRFEHSLGVFRLAALLVKQMAHDADFARLVSVQACELFLLAALLHDLGHYPYCHLIEDLHLGIPRHEEEISRFLLDPECEISRIIRTQWRLFPEDVLYLLSGKRPDAPTLLSDNRPLYALLSSMLSGPVDIDKMDYLQRDSCHAGVPYGRNYDQERLLASLCLNGSRDGLAVSSKGKTAAELLVFARYVMFSEVYWHHAVRSATAMFQRLFFDLYSSEKSEKTKKSIQKRDWLDKLRDATDSDAARLFAELHRNRPSAALCDALFGPKRLLFKQIAEFSAFDYPEIYGALARKPYAFLVQLGRKITDRLGAPTHYLLLDAPPVGREVEFRVNIRLQSGDFRPLQQISPVVRALAAEQFDDLVKRVRIFIHPQLLPEKERILDVFREALADLEA